MEKGTKQKRTQPPHYLPIFFVGTQKLKNRRGTWETEKRAGGGVHVSEKSHATSFKAGKKRDLT